MASAFELYLIRHAIAADRGEEWPDDDKRPLTDDGIARMRKAARGFARLDLSIDIVFTSPLVRARQTADIVIGALDPRPTLVTIDSLAPGGAYAVLMGDLEKHGRKSRFALVGHEPGLGELAGRLIGSRHAIEFKKGAICRIDVDQIPPGGPGHLRWFLPPRILRAIKN